jgi:alcohol dehydrogenase (cytochrome c)
MAHGGGMTWISPTYDPDLNLLYVGTGNPQPVMAAKKREGANLFTESIVALNADTGKLVWYFQPSPHDTHDWDAVETPVLFDGEMDGKPRKLLAQASRNGWFFVLDRETGKNYVSAPFVKTNWTDSQSCEGAADCGYAGCAECGRWGELASANVQPGHRVVLCQRHSLVCHLLHFRR